MAELAVGAGRCGGHPIEFGEAGHGDIPVVGLQGNVGLEQRPGLGAPVPPGLERSLGRREAPIDLARADGPQLPAHRGRQPAPAAGPGQPQREQGLEPHGPGIARGLPDRSQRLDHRRAVRGRPAAPPGPRPPRGWAMEEPQGRLPMVARGRTELNGSEFINDHLFRYCQAHEIQFTRRPPYKKDDNAHIEQKNWTHVRKLVGYLRYDTPAAVAALNALYRHELRLFQNLFLPSVKLLGKERVGARRRRRYETPRTPLERLQACPAADPTTVASWVALRDQLDPFALSQAIDRKIERLLSLATTARPRPALIVAPAPAPIRRRRRPPPSRHLNDFTLGNHLRRPVSPPSRVTS